MFEQLMRAYGHLAPVVQRGGRAYPAATERATEAGAGLVRLERGRAEVDAALRAGGQAHLASVRKVTPGLYDGEVLACLDARGFPIRCATASYFDAIATSDSLRAEYEQSLRRDSASADPLALPLRRLAHRAAGEDVLRSGRGRVACVGLSIVVTVPLPAGGRAFIIGLRNERVAGDPGMWHLAPSGTLEPGEGQGDPVLDAAERELAEELGLLLGPRARLAARLKPLGIGFDLLRLRVEICLRLDLHEHECPPGGPALASAEFKDRAMVELAPGPMRAFWEDHPPHMLAPAAAAALALLEQGPLPGSAAPGRAGPI